MKKLVLSFLVICSIFTMTVSSNQVGANDFAGNESKYISYVLHLHLKNQIKKLVKSSMNIFVKKIVI